jgi:hypothetical protein
MGQTIYLSLRHFLELEDSQNFLAAMQSHGKMIQMCTIQIGFYMTGCTMGFTFWLLTINSMQETVHQKASNH